MPETAFPDTETETNTWQLPPYAVMLHNDDYNSMPFVAFVLKSVFGYPMEKCVELMLEAHETGQAVVWVGSLEVAEMKADLMVGFGPDPSNEKAEKLRVTVEPA
ncbi:MAG: ATP-dependent Clp protease adaptor ClpS [Fimbriiglobus sp.]